MGRIIATNSEDPRDKRPLVSIPNRDATVSQQVGTLLAAANSFMAFIANTRNAEKDEPEVSSIDGGAKCAVETTLIGICSRLDKIMADESRWGMELQDTLENQLSQLYAEHTKSLVEQRHALKMSTAPQTRLSPQLVRMADGTWAAFIGDPLKDNSVVGLGACVQDALDSFDLLVQGKPAPFNEQIEKKYEQEQQRRVDGSGNCPSETTQPKNQQKGDSPDLVPKPKVRRAKTRKTPRRGRSRKNRPQE